MSFFDDVEREVHAARPRLRNRDGVDLVADLMHRVGNDKLQRTPATLDYEEMSGYVADEESAAALRFLLRVMEGR